MKTIEQQYEEIQQLKKLQVQHRAQLQENRERAKQKRKETGRMVQIGKIVTELLPEVSWQSDEELYETLKRCLSAADATMQKS